MSKLVEQNRLAAFGGILCSAGSIKLSPVDLADGSEAVSYVVGGLLWALAIGLGCGLISKSPGSKLIIGINAGGGFLICTLFMAFVLNNGKVFYLSDRELNTEDQTFTALGVATVAATLFAIVVALAVDLKRVLASLLPKNPNEATASVESHTRLVTAAAALVAALAALIVQLRGQLFGG
jgi:hypothetical protein